MYFRKSVWANGGDFDDPILLWYAQGVGEMQKRPLSDSTSWRFLAAIHGINYESWAKYGYYTQGEAMPPQPEQRTYWDQCQHHSWYFLPWHRGYLLSLEAIVRQAVIQLGGPADWALPYWDYSATDGNARQLPPAFSRKMLPDGSANPLYVAQRWGADDGTLPLPQKDVSLKQLNDIRFVGASSGGSPGFGGPETVFHHGGGSSGGLEQLPHNVVHVDIGGTLQNDAGLMTDPDTAGLDPIFYLHHANIDRLWAYWLTLGGGRSNPSEQAWLNGPVSRLFVVPAADGTPWRFVPHNVLTTEELDYQYSPLGNNDPIPVPRASRAQLLGFAAPSVAPLVAPAGKPTAELIGANDSQIKISHASKSTVAIDSRMMARCARSFSSEAIAKSFRNEPNRFHLNLESIRANVEGLNIDVHINLDGKQVFVAPIGLFGAKKASQTDLSHGGEGITVVLDITDMLDELHLAKGIDSLANFEVIITPRKPLADNVELSIERISLYREF